MSDNARGGNDTLISGSGIDHMWGDAQIINGLAASPTADTGTVKTGADTFVFAPGNGNDDIGDFRQSDHDKIDVSAYGFHNLAQMMITFTGDRHHDRLRRNQQRHPCRLCRSPARVGLPAGFLARALIPPRQNISGVMTFCGRGPTIAARMVSADLSRMSSHASGVKKAECGVMIRRPSHHGSRAR